MFRAFLFITIVISLTSCEGVIEPKGHVYDKSSRLPLDSVEVILFIGNKDYSKSYDSSDRIGRSFTNDSGYFEVSSGLIEMLTGKPKYKVLLSKIGYKSLGVDDTKDSIFMEREK